MSVCKLDFWLLLLVSGYVHVLYQKCGTTPLYSPRSNMLLSYGKKDKYCIIPSKYFYQVYYLSKQSVQKHFFLFLEKVYSILK